MIIQIIGLPGSGKTELAKSIDKNEKIELISTTDMGVIEKDGNLIKVVKDIQEKSFKAGYNESDVQVLYPKYKGENGIDKLNAILKPKINEKEKRGFFDRPIKSVYMFSIRRVVWIQCARDI